MPKSEPFPSEVDKAPRLSISIVIWILSSDTDICQLNQFNLNSEAAMPSRLNIAKGTTDPRVEFI